MVASQLLCTLPLVRGRHELRCAARAAGQPRYPGDREEVHYVITEVIDSEHDQVLRLHSKYRGREVFAHLRSPWSDLPYRVGDAVNLLATLDCFDGQYHCLLDMERGMLVLHPDVLLSGESRRHHPRRHPCWQHARSTGRSAHHCGLQL